MHTRAPSSYKRTVRLDGTQLFNTLKLLMRMKKPLQALQITISYSSRRAESRAWSDRLQDWADVFWMIYLLEDFLGGERYATLSGTFGAFENTIEQLNVFDHTSTTWKGGHNAANEEHESLCLNLVTGYLDRQHRCDSTG